MPTILDKKKELRNLIKRVIMRDGKARRDVLLSSVTLETGFKKPLIDELIQDMINIEELYYDDVNNTLTTIRG